MRLLLALLLISWSAPLAAGPKKKLIEFGWDIPDAAYLRANIRKMEEVPFDGVIMSIKALKGGQPVGLDWEVWGKHYFAPGDVAQSVEDLKATEFHRFTDNFIRFNVCPANLDWFEDYGAVMSNAGLCARVCRQTGMVGILFDIEQYTAPLWHYPKQKHADTKSWKEYAAQVRMRGRQFVAAVQREYPSIAIMLTFGYSLPYTGEMRPGKSLERADYGLLAPFLDGMVEEALPTVKIVDGFEFAYPYKEERQFTGGYHYMTAAGASVCAFPDKYRQVFKAGFGLWMDCNSGSRGWHPEDFSKNHFQPAEFQRSVHLALQTCDGYVWIYTERLNWWTGEKVPREYLEALRKAREGI